MRRRLLALTVTMCLIATGVSAQTDTTVVATRFQLSTGPCTIRSGVSGSGDPNGVITGNVCDLWINSSTSETWEKVSGSTGNTGWLPILTSTILHSVIFGADNTYDIGAAGATRPKDLHLAGTATIGGNVVPYASYSGNLGLLTKKWLTLNVAELWAETLVAQNTLATIGGRVLVGSTSLLTADLGAGDTTMHVKYSLADNDIGYFEANSAVEFVLVGHCTAETGGFSCTITRNQDGSGANAWSAGDAIFNTGQATSGWIDLYSVRGVKAATEAGPSIVGNVRNSATYNDWTPRWAIGNLEGLYGVATGTPVWGSVFGDPAKTNVLINDTSGFSIRFGTTNKLQADTSGNLDLAGSMVVTGSLSAGSGAVTLNSSGLTLANISGVSAGAASLKWGTEGTTHADSSNHNVYSSATTGWQFNAGTRFNVLTCPGCTSLITSQVISADSSEGDHGTVTIGGTGGGPFVDSGAINLRGIVTAGGTITEQNRDYPMGAKIPYTPTLAAGGGGSLSSTSASCTYSRTGDTIHMQCEIGFTASGTVSSVTVTLPVSAATRATSVPVVFWNGVNVQGKYNIDSGDWTKAVFSLLTGNFGGGFTLYCAIDYFS